MARAHVPKTTVSGAGGIQRILIIGAGVSGCACAATLAEAGIAVTLMSSALDRVGEPGFGPEVVAGGVKYSVGEVLERLPCGLREAWTGAALVSEDGSYMTVDRRLLSIETKRVLERMLALELRQGLVSGLRVIQRVVGTAAEPERCVCVETVFGEKLEADLLVVAVGLGLAGAANVLGPEMGLERYGDRAGEGLGAGLGELGARFELAKVEVGPCFGGRSAGRCVEDSDRPGHMSVFPLVRVPLERMNWGCENMDAAMEEPESPYRLGDLWPAEGVALRSQDGVLTPFLSPDGLATGEVALAPEYADDPLRDSGVCESVLGCGRVLSKPSHSVQGLAVVNVDDTGRLLSADGSAVWITGRASGARGYLDSLWAGVCTGEAIAGAIGVQSVRVT